MDSDAWRPFDPVDVKRQVGSGRSNNRQGFVEQLSDEDDIDDHGEDYDSDGDFASGDSDHTWLDVSEVTFITLKIDAGADLLREPAPASRDLGFGAAWRRQAASARRSTHDRAEGLGARLGITDGADRSRAREQFLRFVCR